MRLCVHASSFMRLCVYMFMFLCVDAYLHFCFNSLYVFMRLGVWAVCVYACMCLSVYDFHAFMLCMHLCVYDSDESS